MIPSPAYYEWRDLEYDFWIFAILLVGLYGVIDFYHRKKRITYPTRKRDPLFILKIMIAVSFVVVMFFRIGKWFV